MTADEAIAILYGATVTVLNRDPELFVEAAKRGIEALDLERQAARNAPTMGDRIRTMSDGELADFIEEVAGLGELYNSICQNKKECCEMMERDELIPDEWCRSCRIEWLRKPMEGKFPL